MAEGYEDWDRPRIRLRTRNPFGNRRGFELVSEGNNRFNLVEDKRRTKNAKRIYEQTMNKELYARDARPCLQLAACSLQLFG